MAHGARIVAVLLFELSWAEGHDGLDVCSEKPGSTTGCSDADAAVACWSRDPTVRAIPRLQGFVPKWASHPLTANAACQTLEDSLGQRSYSGACSFKVPGLRFPMQRVPSPRSWDESYALAERLLPLMTLEEKQRLLQGIGWNGAKFELNHGYYVGTTRPVDRLAVPGLNFQEQVIHSHSLDDETDAVMEPPLDEFDMWDHYQAAAVGDARKRSTTNLSCAGQDSPWL
ncbi:unnamed protein product [Symbiodinium necroappetens]|uniref:Uncharacterized protein n=1 Tax=Symbiodinium necroappetens TaxID=1628268 RepID=A0A813A619_9DINO|nr:unnamed protein product [Symbiodinium necroappetens]